MGPAFPVLPAHFALPSFRPAPHIDAPVPPPPVCGQEVPGSACHGPNSCGATIWRNFAPELTASATRSMQFSDSPSQESRDFLLDRAARKFAPSNLLRYFDAWLNWSSFCKLADAAPHSPPAGLLPDCRQGLATTQLRALAWFCKTAGLPNL